MQAARRVLVAIVAVGETLSSNVQAQDAVFGLGRLEEITVVGAAANADTTDEFVTLEDVWTFNRNTLDEAIKLVPGVSSTLDGNGRRNERGITVRGFGRAQVPLSIDGIRIYLPADNRLDFNDRTQCESRARCARCR